jgi:hypothetical protein
VDVFDGSIAIRKTNEVVRPLLTVTQFSPPSVLFKMPPGEELIEAYTSCVFCGFTAKDVTKGGSLLVGINVQMVPPSIVLKLEKLVLR